MVDGRFITGETLSGDSASMLQLTAFELSWTDVFDWHLFRLGWAVLPCTFAGT